MLVQIYEVRTPEEAIALTRLGVDRIGVLVGNGAFPRELDADRAREVFAATPSEASAWRYRYLRTPMRLLG